GHAEAKRGIGVRCARGGGAPRALRKEDPMTRLSRLRHLRRDERGMSLVFIGCSLMGFMAASTLAIDVGMVMTARTQAQTAADAGALAGAVALAFNSSTDHTSSGPAVQGAIN